MPHKFKLRQMVRLTRAAASRSGSNVAGSWEIVRLMPEDQTGECAYRIRAGGLERAALESEIEAA